MAATSPVSNNTARALDIAPASTCDPETLQAIEALKRDRDAIILAHYYVDPAVQALADHVGDSFALARLAATLPNRTLVFCGVRFMGESAKILSPDKTVLMPSLEADCPMAHMVAPEFIARIRAEHPGIAVVTYVNSTAEVKAVSDVCVTSSNAQKIVAGLPNEEIFFCPDRNLGRYIASQLPEKHFILNPGCCPRHEDITYESVRSLVERYPDAPVLMHPECTPELLKLATFAGSTKEIIEQAAASDAEDIIVVTVVGVSGELKRRCAGQGKHFHFPAPEPRCPGMDLVTVDNVLACLADETDGHTITLDGAVADAAREALERMLEYGAR